MCARQDIVWLTSDLSRYPKLADEHLLMTEKGCCYRNQFERLLIGAGAYTGNVSEFVSVETIKQCVKMGLGIAALSHASVKQELDKGELQELAVVGSQIHSSIHLVYNEKQQQAENVAGFIGFCEEFAFW